MSAIYGVVGGGTSRKSIFFGGDENLVKKYRDYESSAESKAKLEMVRKLLTVFENLKFDGLPAFPTSDDTSELSMVADKLKDVVYNKLKRGIKDDPEAQKKLCKALARELNSVFGKTVVNEDYNVETICNQVNEFCLSFARGLHLEFFKIQNDVKISIKNIKLLIEVMKNTTVEINNLIKSTKDNEAIGKYSTIANIYNAAQNELERQIVLLENLMNIKTGDQMPLAFEPGSDMKPLIKSIGINVDDFGKNYSDNILSSLYGMVSVAVIAARVHKALKEVGLSVNDYKGFSNVSELKSKLSDAVGSRGENFVAFEKAQEVLEKNFKDNVGNNDWNKLLEALEKTGGVEIRPKTIHDEFDSDGTSNYDSEGKLISKFEKEIDKQYAEKSAIIRSFSLQIATKYENLVKALDDLVRNFDKIKIDDKTNIIRTNLANLVSYDENKRIELALIGVFDTVDAREDREMFLMSLKNIMQSCDGVSGFDSLHSAIKSLYDMIVHFYETARPKFGGAKEDRKNFIDLIPEINRSGLSLKAGINKFVYYYYLAKVRLNSAKSADAIEGVSGNYIKLMGLAVGSRINDLKKTLNAQVVHYENKNDTPADQRAEHFDANGDNIKISDAIPYGLFTHTIDNSHFKGYNTIPANGAADNEKAGECKKQYRKFIENRIKVLENFYAAVQALDLYLKAFTVEINQHPEKIAELKKMINETEMIGSWYNDKTGNKLCDYFNNSIYRVDNANLSLEDVSGRTDYYNSSKDDHYYKQVSGKATNIIFCDRTKIGGGGENVFTATNITTFGDHIAQYDNKKKNIDDAIDNFTGFKNLINIFAKIGNIESKSIFLSPAQLYKYFTDFMKNNSIDISKIEVQGKHLLGIVESAAVGPISTFNAYGYYPLNFENKLFKHCIKAMVGKVFVTIGFYEILHNITPVGMINQTRIILGGGNTQNLESVDARADVSELYFRLPRLVEFYRSVLVKAYNRNNIGLPNAGDDNTKVITMLPDISGTFSGILKVIFDIKADTEEITYSDEQLRTIIDEANKIYDIYHNTTDAVNALVADVNSRFGMVMKKVLRDYYTEQKRLEQDYSAGVSNEVNYQLFPDEGARPTGKAPSDMYVDSEKVKEVTRTDALDIKVEATNELFGLKQLEEFHDKINDQFKNIKPEQLDKSFDLFIQYGARKISEAKDKDARISVAFSLIQDNKNYEVDPLKLQMFQETVVVGLNALKHIDDSLDNFVKNVYILRLVRARQEQTCVNAVISQAAGTAHRITNIVDSDAVDVGLYNCTDKINGFVPRVFPNISNDKYLQDKIKNLVKSADILKCFTFGTNAANRGRTLQIDTATVNIQYLPGGGNVLSLGVGVAVEQNVERAVMCNDWKTDAGVPNFTEANQKNYAALIHTITNYDYCMQLYLENIFSFVHGSNGLVSIDINDKDIKFNISKLRTRIDAILSGVKEYIAIFRNFMPEKYINQYVKSDSPSNVSIFKIEKTLIYDKFDNTKNDDNLTLSYAFRLNSDVHKWLLADKPDVYTFWRTVHNGAINVNANSLGRYKPYPYGKCIGELIYKFNKLGDNIRPGNPQFIDIEVNNKPFYRALGMMTQSGDQVWPQPGYGKIDFDDREKKFKLLNVCDTEKDIGSGSLIQSINQLVLRLVNVCSEITPNVKIYSTLVNTVCAGAFGNVLKDVNNNSLPDLVQTDLRIAPVNKTDGPKGREVVSRYDLFLNGFVNTDALNYGVLPNNTGNNLEYPNILIDWNTGGGVLGLKDADQITIGGIRPGTPIARMLAAIFRWHLQNYVNVANNANNYTRTIFAAAAVPNQNMLGYAHNDPAILPTGGNIVGNNARGAAGPVNKTALENGFTCLNILLKACGEPEIKTSEAPYDVFTRNSAIYEHSMGKAADDAAGDRKSSYPVLRAANTAIERTRMPVAATTPKFIAFNVELEAIKSLLQVIYRINNKFLTHYNLVNDPKYLSLTILEEPNFLVNYAGPQEDQLLLSSLAYILRTVNASVVKNTSVPSNMTLSLTDVPLYVREQMRANLPVFVHLFDLLNKKAEFLLQFSKLALKDDHYVNYLIANAEYNNAGNIFNNMPDNQKCNCKRLQPGMLNSDERKYQLHPYMTNLGTSCRSYFHGNNDKDYIFKLLNKIAETTFTLYDSCNNVLQELGDIGVFGQTHESFIESYERRYKMKPLTPYSLYLTMLTNTSDDNKKLFDVAGTSDFKRNYAIRGLLNGPVSETILPYNADLKIEGDYFKFLNNVHDLITMHFNELLLNKFNTVFQYKSKRFMIGKKIEDRKQVVDPNRPNDYVDDLVDVVTGVIEEPNQKLYIAKLVDQFTESDGEKTRSSEITRNIVDLNIIPFNVNLLMRDIPLTNIYNYSIAFDKFIKMFIGSQNNSATGKLFVKLMQEPYLDLGKYDVNKDVVSDAVVVGKVEENLHELRNIFIGDDSLGMGRPKFLSDQLFNKVLTQSVYDNRHDEKLSAINTDNHLNTDHIRNWIRYVNAHKKAVKEGYIWLNVQTGAADVNLTAAGLPTTDGTKHYTHAEMLNTIGDGIVTYRNVTEQRAGFPTTPAHFRAALLRWLAQLDNNFSDIGNGEADACNGYCKTTAVANVGRIFLRTNAAGGANLTNSIRVHITALGASLANAGVADDYANIATTIYGHIRALKFTQKQVYETLQAIANASGLHATVNQATNDMLHAVKMCELLVYLHGGSKTVTDAAIEAESAVKNKDYFNFANEYNKALYDFISTAPAIPNATVLNYKQPELMSTAKSSRYTQIMNVAGGKSLSYVDKDGQLQFLTFPQATMALFDKNYEYRFNTTVVRNLFFITNLNRVLRLLFEKTLTHSRDVIKHGFEFTNPSLTEYGQFPMFPNETLGSKQNNGFARYSRQDDSKDFYNTVPQ